MRKVVKSVAKNFLKRIWETMTMNKSYDVIVFGAHPDDAEMGMAGTIVKLVKAGYSVMSVALTRSEMSTHGEIDNRKDEFETASKIMGCACMMLDFPDTGIENDRESRVRIARIIRELRPKIVFAPYHTNPLGELMGLAHVDHYTTGSLVRDAIKFARLEKTVPDMPKHAIQKLFFYMVPRTVWPNLVLDVSDVIDQATEAIRAYRSQMAINVSGIPVDQVVLTRRANIGLSIGTRYAEAFVCDMPLQMEPKDFLRL